MRQAISLDGSWQFNWGLNPADTEWPEWTAEAEGWLPAQVPGTVHADLLREGRIEDPFVDKQAEDCRWIEWENFSYRRAVRIPAEWAGKRIILECEALDCFATLFLDGEKIGSSNNAFVEQRFEVTPLARPGTEQSLVIYFESPVGAMQEKAESSPVKAERYPEYIYARRPAFSYGWDFAPRLVGCGIWRPIRLVAVEEAWIESAWLKTEKIEDGAAQVVVEVEVDAAAAGGMDLKLEVSLTHGTQQVCASVTVSPAGERTKIQIPLTIEQPALWFPHSHGRPELYDLSVKLSAGGRALDSREEKAGIRLLRVLQEPQADGGTSFIFEVNGQKVFCKGANWVPADSLTVTPTPERCEHLLGLARSGGMNMLRVWGGGVYESDAFYAACDRLGILVWQDFMFACNVYPDLDREYMENVRQEADKAVRRLRQHPSLAIWCGNNENDWGWSAWGWKERFDRFYGEKIYHELLPQACAEHDPTRLYWPSSPFGGPEPNGDQAGDIHDWRVWHERLKPEEYGARHPHFVSEFGIQGSPHIATVRRMLTPQAQWPIGKVWEAHHRDPKKMAVYMKDFGKPANLEQYVQLSQMAQAAGLGIGIEIYRRRLWECSGSLVWQFNEPWPTHCWSMIDYEGRPKGSFFAARRAYENPMVSLEKTDAGLGVWLVNDSPEAIQGTLEIRGQDFAGKILFQEERAVEAPAGTAVCVETITGRKLRLASSGGSFWGARLTGDKFESQRAWFAKPQRKMNWPEARLRAWIEGTGQERTLVIESENYARWVELGTAENRVDFEDNYFDLWPGEQRRIRLPQGAEAGSVELRAWNLKEMIAVG